MFENLPDIMTVIQVSQALQIGRNSAYMLVNRGKLGCIRIGHIIRVPKNCLIEYVGSAQQPIKKDSGS